MKNDQTNLLFVMPILACLAVSCSMLGGSNVANSSNNSISTNVNAAVPKTENAPMLAAPKLLDMLVADVAGLNERLKDKEIIVIGEVADAMNSIRFTGGFNRDIYCTLASDDPVEKWQKVQDLTDAYILKRRPTMPIVEAKGVFTRGSVSPITTPYKGTQVAIFLDKCTIVSIKE